MNSLEKWRKVKVYNTEGYVADTEYYRVFRDEEWPEPEDYTAEEIQADAENQDLSLPRDQEDSKEHEQSLPLTTRLVYTSENVDAAELSADDCGDCDCERRKEGLKTTDCHINSPGVLPQINMTQVS